MPISPVDVVVIVASHGFSGFLWHISTQSENGNVATCPWLPERNLAGAARSGTRRRHDPLRSNIASTPSFIVGLIKM